MIVLPSEFYNLSKSIPVVDVRTPAEFAQGHIPGAFNIPIFSNEERAIIGTIYKKNGKDDAVQKGLIFVGPKMHDFVVQAKKIAKNNKILVHCWRGGMRSQSMVWLFKTAGLEAHSLLGGYKAYRMQNREILSTDVKMIVLGGYTGSGKTHILKEIAKLGEQVIDLEGIAHHKGSAFGHIGELPQPTTEQFENDLAAKWKELDFSRIIWVEDESKAIGRIFQPEVIYNRLRNTQLLFIDVPIELRVKNLVEDYTGIDAAALEDSLGKIIRRLGGNNYKIALEALHDGDYATVARISLSYYDKAYYYGMSLRDQNKVYQLTAPEESFAEIAKKLVQLSKTFTDFN